MDYEQAAEVLGISLEKFLYLKRMAFISEIAAATIEYVEAGGGDLVEAVKALRAFEDANELDRWY